MYRYETKTELRAELRGQVIREVMCKGALTDTRAIELRLTNGRTIQIAATPYGTLEVTDA